MNWSVKRFSVLLHLEQWFRPCYGLAPHTHIIYRETPPTSPTEKTPRKPSAGDNTYESIKNSAPNPMDLNTYEAIGSPNVKAASSVDSRTYEPIDTPPVYSYAAVDTPVRVLVPGDSAARDSSQLVSSEHNGNNQSVDKGGKNMKTPVGSLVDNAAYGDVKHGFEVSDKEDINNPMYGDAKDLQTQRN